MQVHKMIQN